MQRVVSSLLRPGLLRYFFLLSLILGFFLISIISPKSAKAATLGITDISNPDGTSGLHANVINCSGFLTGANSGTITDINAYMAGVGGTSNVRYAIYSGDDDEPTNLLWQSNSLPLTPADANAWFTIATGGVEFTSNSSIWLCENSDAENTATGNFVTVNTQGLIAEKSFPFGSFPQTPDNWRLPNPNVQYAMYVNYIPTNLPQITILNPAEVWLSKGLLNVGVRFDLLAEVFKDSTLVSSGQLNSVQVGSGGFNNADLVSVPFNSFSPVDFPQGSELKIKVSVRNACTGSLPNQGTARLWFNDNQANSHFGATIGTTNNSYYLLDNFLLSTTVGAGPRQNIDVQAGAKCSPFKSFGTWTITP